jgi:hypothetical protein
MSENPRLFALLIDGDNVSVSLVPRIQEKIGEYGKLIIKRVYLNEPSKNWNVIINDNSLSGVWVTNNTKGKNASDIALVIDAMDLLLTRSDLAGFCIVSSDSDFTRLAAYIVEKNKFMLGIGEDHTPLSFVKACSEFVYIKNLLQPRAPIEQPKNIVHQAQEKPNDTNLSFEALFVTAYENSTKDKDEWIQPVEIKEKMNALDNEFQSSEYQNMRRLAEKIREFAASYPKGVIEIDEKVDSKHIIHHIRIDLDAFRFIEAYHQAPYRERDGWVLLSNIGDALKKQPAYTNGFSYRGIRQNQLIKIIREMVKDYPIIEIKDDKDENSVLYYIRIKSS